MRNVKTIADFHSKAKSVRTIARGIFDQRERRFLLRFVRYCEKVAAQKLKASGGDETTRPEIIRPSIGA